MAGLEKITAAIIQNAEVEASHIIEDAEKKEKLMIEESKKSAKASRDKIIKKVSEEVKIILNNAESAGALDKKNKILAAKMELIENVFEKTFQELKSLPSNEYFKIITKLVLSGSLNGKGLLVLSDTDIKRMPADFIASLNKSLPDDNTIELDKTPDNRIDGGCVLKYGNIEINCCFAAILSEKREKLIDIISEVLFA